MYTDALRHTSRLALAAHHLRILSITWLAVITSLLMACGGGGGADIGSAPPGEPPPVTSAQPEPPPQPGPTPLAISIPATPTAPSLSYGVKQFVFSWPATTSATFYRLMEDLDGEEGAQLAQSVGGDIQTLTFSHTVPLYQRLGASYRIQACNAAGCSISPSVLPDVNAAIGYFKAHDLGAHDRFGYAVAVSDDGHTLAVGAPQEDGMNATQENSGAVYVYRRNAAGHWSNAAKLKASNAAVHQQFGSSLDLSSNGQLLAVGAPQEDGSGIGDSGAVYLFSLDEQGQWHQISYVKSIYPDFGDRFGESVALSDNGETLVVGAPGERSNFDGITTTTSLLPGSPLRDNSAANAGAVYVFSRLGSAWINPVFIKPLNSTTGQYFGMKISLSADGNTLAVGAPFHNGALPFTGAAYVFGRNDTGAWSQLAFVQEPAPIQQEVFGHAIALSGDGNTLAVGATRQWLGSNGGAVTLFSRVGNSWAFSSRIQPTTPVFMNFFGGALALSHDGLSLAVGASSGGSSTQGAGLTGNPITDTMGESGAVYLYLRSSAEANWALNRFIKTSNPAAEQHFGNAVALSADGKTLAVGAYMEGNQATSGVGITTNPGGAVNSGAAYLY